MPRRLFVYLLVIGLRSTAGAEEIVLSPTQQAELAIHASNPRLVQHVEIERMPARVTVPANREFVVSVPLQGLTTRVLVAVGATVKVGQALAELNSPASLSLQRQFLQARISERLAKAKLTRDQALLQEGVIARMRYQETESEYERAAAELRETEQTVTLGGLTAEDVARLKKTGELRSQLTLRAPSAGMVIERNVMVGQRVEPFTPLFRIADAGQLLIELAVPQERLESLKVGDTVMVENRGLAAHIAVIGGAVDARSQTVPVWAELEGGQAGLRPGQQIVVDVQSQKKDHLIAVPSSALFQHAGASYVFVKHTNGFVPRQVVVAAQTADVVTLSRGVDIVDDVVDRGVAVLKASWIGIGGGED